MTNRCRIRAHEEPQTLTVEEAARILRIGRTAAYALAREWRATNGRSGLPVLELGRTLRVPRAALMAMLSDGRTRRPPDAA
jgi:excisionase family DNA binding protein